MNKTPSARLAAAMDRELARQGFTPGVSGAAKAVDISGMDSLSRSMRARLPAHQRAAYDQSWAQAQPAPLSPAVRSPGTIPAGATLTPAEIDANVLAHLGVHHVNRTDEVAKSAPAAAPPVAKLWSPPGGASTPERPYESSGMKAVFAAVLDRAPRDAAEIEAAFVGLQG